MDAQVLALVVEDRESGYNVVDSRDGRPVSWHGDLHDANAIAAYLNSTYPDQVAPARDGLIFEVLCMRVGGEPPTCIETWLMTHRPWNAPLGAWCPWGLPTGAGWDHLYDAARRS